MQLRFLDKAFYTGNNALQYKLKTEEGRVALKFATQMQVLRLDFVPRLSIL